MHESDECDYRGVDINAYRLRDNLGYLGFRRPEKQSRGEYEIACKSDDDGYNNYVLMICVLYSLFYLTAYACTSVCD